MEIWQRFMILLKVSRPPLWIVLPLVFCMGLAYGQNGLTNPSFHFTPLMILQISMLSFPFCLFTFGLNDIYDQVSDQSNPRKKGIEGIRLESVHHRMIKMASWGIAVVFLFISAGTVNLVNLYFSMTMLILAFVYSVPPWRLKARAPLDVVSAGILGFLSPFALGFSFVDDATTLPLQTYYFTLCVMGFHAFSTIMDYEVDRESGDCAFAVAYGKRAAALFPAAVFLCSLFLVHVMYIRAYFGVCAVMCTLVCVWPSEKIARYSFLAMFLGAITIVTIWIIPFVF